MSTENQTAAAAKPPGQAAASKPRKQRSKAEKIIVRTLLVVGIALIAFEVRAKYGYDSSLAYLTEAMKTEELRVRSVSSKLDDMKKMTAEEKAASNMSVPEMDEDNPPTWGGINSEAFGSLSFLAGVLRGSPGEPKYQKPVLHEKAALYDKDGNKIELNNEKTYERELRWSSLRDLWEEHPAYVLVLKLNGEGDDAEIVGYRTGGEDPDPPPRPGNFIPQEQAESMLGAGGGATPRRPPAGADSGKGRPQRPGAEDGKADEGKADEGKADEGKADEGKADAGKADAGKADAGKADAGKADAGKADEGKADEGKADEGKADEGKEGSGS